jgi:hypothetical protein
MTEPVRLSAMPEAEARARRALAWARARHPRLAAAVARRPLRWIAGPDVLHGGDVTLRLGPATAFRSRALVCVVADAAGRPIHEVAVAIPAAACEPARGVRAALRIAEPEGAA